MHASRSAVLQVNPQRLAGFLKQVARERSPYSAPEGLQEVVSFLEKTLKGLGYTVHTDPVPFEGQAFPNLIARRDSPAFEPLIIGAHYDAVEGSPGADDNASGVAVLCELASVLASHPVAAKIQFVAFTLEECGMVGSTHYVDRLKWNRSRLNGMISLEMVGFTGSDQHYPFGLGAFYPKQGNFIGVGANWNSRPLLNRFVRGMRQVAGLRVETIVLPGNGSFIPDIRLSDQAPFWDAGYPALLITDTAFYRNPNYHTGSDTVETLDQLFLSQVAQGVLEGVLNAISES